MPCFEAKYKEINEDRQRASQDKEGSQVGALLDSREEYQRSFGHD